MDLNKKMDAYDVTLGFTYLRNNGFTVIGNVKSAKYKVLILGNSTSLVQFCNEKSWPEFFYEKCKGSDLDVALICGGMLFNNSWQELLRLERDGLYFNPDLVISYSGVCNIDVNYEAYLNKNDPYVWNYQEELAQKLVKNKKLKCTLSGGYNIQGVSVGTEKTSFSYSKWWVDTMRMMNGICTEFGVPFLGFLQPNIFVGNPKLDGSEHIGGVNREYVERLRNWYAETRGYIEQLNYIDDFTSIFDGEDNIYWDTCHVYEKGNRIISDEIYNKARVFFD